MTPAASSYPINQGHTFKDDTLKYQILKDKSDLHVTSDQSEKFNKDLKRANLIKKITRFVIGTGAITGVTGGTIAYSASIPAILFTAIVIATTKTAVAGAVTASGAAIIAAPVSLAVVPVAIFITGLAVAGIGLAILGVGALGFLAFESNYEKYRFINPYDKEQLFKDLINPNSDIQNNRLNNLPAFMRGDFIEFRNKFKTTHEAHAAKVKDLDTKVTSLTKELQKKETEINEKLSELAKQKKLLIPQLHHDLKKMVANHQDPQNTKLGQKLAGLIDSINNDKQYETKDLEEMPPDIKQKISEAIEKLRSLKENISKLQEEHKEKNKKFIELKTQIQTEIALQVPNEFNKEYNEYIKTFENAAYAVHVAHNDPFMKKEDFIKRLKNQIINTNHFHRIVLLEKLINHPNS